MGGVCNVNYAAVSGTELMIEHWNLVIYNFSRNACTCIHTDLYVHVYTVAHNLTLMHACMHDLCIHAQVILCSVFLHLYVISHTIYGIVILMFVLVGHWFPVE